MSLPLIRVEIGDGAGAATSSPTWVDVTEYLLPSAGVRFNRGRSDERASAQPGSLSLTFKNDDGYWATLPLRTPIRVLWGVGADTLYDGDILYDADVLYDAAEPIWTGLIDEFYLELGGRPTCRVKASDRLSQLERLTLSHWETEQHLLAAPSFLWPLTDPAGSTTVGEVGSGTALPGNILSTVQVGSGGSFELEVGGLPVDDGTVAAFNPVDVSNGVYLRTTSATVPGSFTGQVYSVLMNSVTPAVSTLVRWVDIYGAYVDLSINGSGYPVVTVYSPFGQGTATATGTTNVCDGEWHCLVAAMDAFSEIAVWVDGVEEDTTVVPHGAISSSVIYIGGTPSGRMFSGQMSHCAMWADQLVTSTIVDETYAALTGAVGETSTERHERLCAFAGVDSAVVGTGVSTIGIQPTLGLTLLEALNQNAAAELAPVYVDVDGVPTLAARDERYGAPVALTVTAADVSLETAFTINDEDLINEVRANRPGQGEIRHTDPDSIAQHGIQSEALTLIVEDDDQLTSIAQWKANTFSEPAARTDQLQLDVWVKQSTIDIEDAAGLDVGSRVQVTDLPAGAPVDTLDLFVEGIDDELTLKGWRRTLNTSPVGAAGAVWILDDDDYSILDETTILGV